MGIVQHVHLNIFCFFNMHSFVICKTHRPIVGNTVYSTFTQVNKCIVCSVIQLSVQYLKLPPSLLQSVSKLDHFYFCFYTVLLYVTLIIFAQQLCTHVAFTLCNYIYVSCTGMYKQYIYMHLIPAVHIFKKGCILCFCLFFIQYCIILIDVAIQIVIINYYLSVSVSILNLDLINLWVF